MIILRTWFICASIYAGLCAIDHAHNIHRYVWANYQQFGGNTTAAQNWYTQIFNTHGSIYTLKGYLHLLDTNRNYQQILTLVDKIGTKFNNDPDIQLIIARAYQNTGQQDKADMLFISLATNSIFETNSEIVLNAALSFIRKKELENALHIIDKFLNKSAARSAYYIFHFLKAQIYAQLNRYEDALANIQTCLNKYPHFDQGWLFLAALQEQAGKLTEAIKGYTTYLEVTQQPNQQIEHHIVQLVLKQKSLQKNQPILHINKPCFEKALILFERKQYKEALSYIDQCIAHNQHDHESKLLKIQILTALHEHQHVIDQLLFWISQEPTSEQWLKTLYLLIYTKTPLQSIIEAFKKIHAQNPQLLMPTLYLADLGVRDHNQELACTYLQKATTLTSDKALKTKLLFQRGRIYYEQKNYTAMKQVLEEGYALKQDFPPLLNLLSYYYAAKDNNFPRAQILIDLTLKKAPQNPHFIDTKAFILYKQKQYDHALALLHPLMHITKDSTMLIHHAKINYKLGNKGTALASIQAAHTYAKHPHEKEKAARLLQRWSTTPT